MSFFKKFDLWINLSSPDANTASRRWVLRYDGFTHTMRLPIKYKANNKFWLRIEKWLEDKSHRFIMIAY